MASLLTFSWPVNTYCKVKTQETVSGHIIWPLKNRPAFLPKNTSALEEEIKIVEIALKKTESEKPGWKKTENDTVYIFGIIKKRKQKSLEACKRFCRGAQMGSAHLEKIFGKDFERHIMCSKTL